MHRNRPGPPQRATVASTFAFLGNSSIHSIFYKFKVAGDRKYYSELEPAFQQLLRRYCLL